MEWEVCKFYWKLHRKETSIIDKGEILERIGDVKQISKHDKENREQKISMEEVSNTLKNNRSRGRWIYRSCLQGFLDIPESDHVRCYP